jgi:transposase InsO family protein
VLIGADRDSKFSGGFDEILRSERVRVIRTPVRAPNANAYAERWVRTVRADCLDHFLIVGRRQLERVLRVYVRHYNAHRPHRALGLAPPDRSTPVELLEVPVRVTCRDLLGGLIHEYQAAA